MQIESKWPSLSQMDRRICELFFFWSVFNVFLGAMFGGAIFSQLAESIKDPGNKDVQGVMIMMCHMDHGMHRDHTILHHIFLYYMVFPCTVLSSSLYEVLFWQSAYLHYSYGYIGRSQ